MNADLFRTEVLQRHTGIELGGVLQWEPPRARALLFFFVGVFMLLLAFAALAPVSRSEVVRGVITADGGPGKLHVPAAGQVDQVLVREGQLVARGEALLTLTPAAYAAAGPLSHRFVAEALAQQLGVVQSQLELLRTRAARDRDDVARRRQALQQALALQALEQALVQHVEEPFGLREEHVLDFGGRRDPVAGAEHGDRPVERVEAQLREIRGERVGERAAFARVGRHDAAAGLFH